MNILGKEKKYRLIVILIGFLALLLRLYRLGEIPVSPIALFGFNEFSVRLPAAVFGALSVILIYLVVKEVFKGLKNKELLGILASLSLTFSPWSYYYSHAAWSVNVFLVFVLLGIIIFFKKKKQISLPKFFMTSLATLTVAVVSFTNTREFLGKYLNHFSLRFLFFEGNWPNFLRGIPVGQLNHLDIILLPLGVYYLVSRQIRRQGLIWYLLLIGPLPAILEKEAVRSDKSYLMLIPLTIISVFGMIFIWEKARGARKAIAYLISAALIAIYLYSFVIYLDQFFVHAPIKYLLLSQ